MRTKSIFFLLFILLQLFLIIFHSFGEEKIIKVGIYDSPPYIIIEKENYSGIFIDLIEYIAVKEGWTLNYCLNDFQKNVDLLQLGLIDILPGIIKDNINSEIFFDITEIPAAANWYTFITDEKSTVNELKDLNKKIIGIAGSNIFRENLNMVLINSGINPKIRSYKNHNSLINALKINHVDAAVINIPDPDCFLTDSRLKKITLPVEPVELNIGISRKSKLLPAVEIRLDDLRTRNRVLYNSIIMRHINLSVENNKNFLFLFLAAGISAVLFILLKIIFINILPAIKSTSEIGRKITSSLESENLYPEIFKSIKKLINPDYFGIGVFENNLLKMTFYSNLAGKTVKSISHKIDFTDSIFIYSVINKKNIFIKNFDTEYEKYVRDNNSFIEIDSSVKSALIIPLIFGKELLGIISILSKREKAFSSRHTTLIDSLTKYITIAMRNALLHNKNQQLLLQIENDKNKILKAKQEVEYIAQHDPLTDLPNRLYLNEFLNQAIKKSNRTGKKLAVIFIDMDNFKEINDTYGHQAGDMVLITAARRFRKLLRESDLVIRFGGDEFIIILEDMNSAEDIKNVVNKIISTCSTPVLIKNADLSLSFSLGISIYPENGNTADELIRKADIALYDVKNSSKGFWKFYRNKV